MTDFNYSTPNITDDMLKESVANVGKFWKDQANNEAIKKLAEMSKGHQMYLVAGPAAFCEVMKMHVESLDYPETPYRFMHQFDYAPMRLGGIPLVKLYWMGYDPGVEVKPDPVVWREEPVVEAVPAWQYWVAAAVFAVILCLAGGVV